MKFQPLSSEELQGFRARTGLMLVVVGVVFIVLLGRLWFLQILEGEYYAELAMGNRIRIIPQEAPRGIIYDREGVILAYNRPAFNIQLIPEDTPDLLRSLKNLSALTQVPTQELQNILKVTQSRYKFKPALLMSDIGRKTADLIDTYQEDLPGISVSIESKRLYPSAYLSSHVLGYVGVINEDQLEKLPINKLISGRIVGQAGVELLQNSLLIGNDGGKQVEVDNVGRELKTVSNPVAPIPGNDVHLTLDIRLQRFIRSAMAGKNGAVIMMKTRTGEVLAMNSFPDYDPNLFVGGIGGKSWDKLTQGLKKPLLNKATQGLYPPGSTFKMVVALAGLEKGVITPESTFHCPGYYRLNRRLARCWKRSGHGDVNVVEALEKSCNVFFYKLGLELGMENIAEFAARLGFGSPTGVELESEKGGLLPSKAWKKRVEKERWYEGDTLTISVGQGYLSATPIQLLNYTNIIANNGLWVRPTLLKKIVNPEGEALLSEESLPRATRLLNIDLKHFKTVREGMFRVVNDSGTGPRARSKDFLVAGKTGTSQVVSRAVLGGMNTEKAEERFRPHSLFVGYAPADNPQVTVMVLVEHGNSGGATAAPLAKSILEYYHRKIEKLDAKPELNPPPAEASAQFERALNQAFVRRDAS